MHQRRKTAPLASPPPPQKESKAPKTGNCFFKGFQYMFGRGEEEEDGNGEKLIYGERGDVYIIFKKEKRKKSD
jgi:hypothetical protein